MLAVTAETPVPEPIVDIDGIDSNLIGPGMPRLVTVYFKTDGPVEGTLDIYTVDGKRLRHIPFRDPGPGNRSVQWDLTNEDGEEVANGVYLLHIAEGGSRRIIRLIVNDR